MLGFQIRMAFSQIIYFNNHNSGTAVIRTRCDAMKTLVVNECHQMLGQCTDPAGNEAMPNISYEINRRI